jgi:hypothetical protein
MRRLIRDVSITETIAGVRDNGRAKAADLAPHRPVESGSQKQTGVELKQIGPGG